MVTVGFDGLSWTSFSDTKFHIGKQESYGQQKHQKKKTSILYQPTFHEGSCDMVSCWSAMFFWAVSIV